MDVGSNVDNSQSLFTDPPILIPFPPIQKPVPQKRGRAKKSAVPPRFPHSAKFSFIAGCGHLVCRAGKVLFAESTVMITGHDPGDVYSDDILS